LFSKIYFQDTWLKKCPICWAVDFNCSGIQIIEAVSAILTVSRLCSSWL